MWLRFRGDWRTALAVGREQHIARKCGLSDNRKEWAIIVSCKNNIRCHNRFYCGKRKSLRMRLDMPRKAVKDGGKEENRNFNRGWGLPWA
jgi:hypothetical protein